MPETSATNYRPSSVADRGFLRRVGGGGVGANPQCGCAILLFWPFTRKLRETERNWTEWGRASPAPLPVDPPVPTVFYRPRTKYEGRYCCTVLAGFCLLTFRGGGYSVPGLEGGYPGYPPGQVWMVGGPRSRSGWEVPHLRSGYGAYPVPDLGGGYPIPGLGGGAPHPRSVWGVPHPRSGWVPPPP